MEKNLLKAKIENIDVIFLEKITLKITNNFDTKREVTKENESKNKEGQGAVDLGYGNSTYTFTCIAKDNDYDEPLSRLLEESREVTITDPRFGKINVLLTNVEIVVNESYINRKVYNVDSIIKYKAQKVQPNYKFKVKDIKKIEKEKLLSDIKNLSKENVSFDKKELDSQFKNIDIDYINKGLSYVESGVTEFVTSLSKVFAILGEPENILGRIQSNAINIKNVVDSIKSIKDYPENFYNSLISTIESIVSIVLPNKKKDIIYTYLNKEKITGESYVNLSGYDKKRVGLSILTNNIVNRVGLLMDIEKLDKGGFKTKSELVNLVNSIFSYFEYFEYFDFEYLDKEKIKSESYLTREFIVESTMFSYDVYQIEEVNFDTFDSIIRYVYERYNSLELLDSIIELNKLKVVTRHRGALKIYL